MDSLREIVCDNVTRTERRKQEVREKILAAAFDLFLAQGVAATKIEEICERADVA
ncbi:MAG TPA: TetR family transcriptional regulator, partial [Mycobacterium sp.]|nr:TetR family transcriptional regulator [Mycobacterium sp.]